MADPIRPNRGAQDSAPPAAPDLGLSITETPEFKRAVAEAARVAATEATAKAIAHFAASKDGGAPGADVQDVLRGLALAIAEMSHQGDKRDKPVDPKVLAERRLAQERMNALIVEASALPKGDPRRPKYKTRSKQVLADHVIDPYRRDPATKKAIPVEFRWCLEPNDAMVPLNDFAERIFAEFRASRGNKAAYDKNAIRPTPWLTDGGLLIEGAPPARREIRLPDVESDVLEVGADPSDPNASHVRVLGTSHPPARQYNADNPMI